MPSPDSCPDRAASVIAATTAGAISSSTMNASRAFGRKRDSKTRPRYSWVTPRWRPWPIASTTVTPTCPVSASTASITVSTRSRVTTASTFVISDLLTSSFDDHDVAPDAVELSEPLLSPDDAKTALQMQRDARFVLGEDPGLDRPDPGLLR